MDLAADWPVVLHSHRAQGRADVTDQQALPDPQRRRRPRPGWLIAAVLLAIVLAAGAILLFPRSPLSTNVTIPLSYIGDDGRTYSCTYDYRTSDRLAMPSPIASDMNARDWSQTGQLIYDWAKTHPADAWTTQDELPADDPESTRADASWALAMARYIDFPPWLIDTPDGQEYELWVEAREGSNCEDGLR